MKEDDYIEYIQKDLLGTISTEERKRLNVWMKESTQNQVLVEDLYKAWEVSEDYGTDLEIDEVADYKIVKKRIEGLSADRAVGGRFKVLRPIIWMSVAASLIAIFAFLFFLRQPENIEVLATQDKYEVNLPDGTKAVLANGTKITYEEDFIENRTIRLTGSAFLEVRHDPSRPFEVQSAHLVTKVLGTKFFIKDSSSDRNPEIQLLEGKVSVLHKGSSKEEILLPGQRAHVDADILKKIERLKTVDFDWYFDDLFFDQIALSDAIAQLESRYGVDIIIDDALQQCSLSGNFSHQPLTEILNSIAGVFGADLEKRTDGYQMLNGQCE